MLLRKFIFSFFLALTLLMVLGLCEGWTAFSSTFEMPCVVEFIVLFCLMLVVPPIY